MSQYPPFEICNLGYAHILPEFKNECTKEKCWCCSPRTGWISVKDQLPKDQQKVLCFGKLTWESAHGPESSADPECWKCIFCSVGYWEIDEGVFDRQVTSVTNWMPLPQPPK